MFMHCLAYLVVVVFCNPGFSSEALLPLNEEGMINISSNQEAWNSNAQCWDAAMGEGSLFQKQLVEPTTLEFLNIKKEDKILDIACGNGQMSRVMAAQGAKVIAVDGSSEMIKLASQRSGNSGITYKVLDVLSLKAGEKLKGSSFDCVLCNMALMDIPEIDPVFKLAYEVLKQGGIFVFSLTHPCFDKAVGPHVTETHEKDGVLEQEHSIKVQRYLSPYTMIAKALPDLPVSHFLFHRPLHTYLNAAFKAGFVMCALGEPAFPKESSFTEHKGWHNLPEIPVVFIAKFKKLALA